MKPEEKSVKQIEEMKRLTELYAGQLRQIAMLEGILEAEKQNIRDTQDEIFKLKELIKKETYETHRN